MQLIDSREIRPVSLFDRWGGFGVGTLAWHPDKPPTLATGVESVKVKLSKKRIDDLEDLLHNATFGRSHGKGQRMVEGPRVAVIIVNWKSCEDPLDCLPSLEKLDYPNYEVVMDDGSTDESEDSLRKAYPSDRVLQTGANLGFAEENNIEIRRHALESIYYPPKPSLPFLEGTR